MIKEVSCDMCKNPILEKTYRLIYTQKGKDCQELYDICYECLAKRVINILRTSPSTVESESYGKIFIFPERIGNDKNIYED